jgi:hypothetical protein
MLTEILDAATDAITAIEQGDIEIAKARLRAILSLMEGPPKRMDAGLPESE